MRESKQEIKGCFLYGNDVNMPSVYTRQYSCIAVSRLKLLVKRGTGITQTHVCRVESISNIRCVWLVFITSLSYIVEISECNANSADPDQTPRSAASDLGLHCLPVSLRIKWVVCSNYGCSKC